MTHYITDQNETETASQDVEVRRTEIARQYWNRTKSSSLAKAEGIDLSNEHWAVIIYLRKHYLKHGLSKHARSLAKDLKLHFKDQGGNKYLYQLFAGGPVTQGCRIANLRTPAYASDRSFGTIY